MKYRIEWDYNDNCLKWSMQIESSGSTDLKDFIIFWMPWLIQDLFEKFGAALKEKIKSAELSEDKVIWVMSLMSIMCQNTLSDRLTESLNNFLGEENEEIIDEINLNPRNSLLWNNQDDKC